MTDSPNKKKKELLKLSRVKLIRKCKMKRLSHSGNKSDMIQRIINSENKKLSLKIKSKRNNSLKQPLRQPSLQSATPKAKRSRSKKHPIDYFQLKPKKMMKMRKAKSLDPRAMKEMKRFQTFAIGGNVFGELAVNHTNALMQLTNINKSKSINRVYSGFQFTIYTEGKSKKYWACGYNSFGELGICSVDEWVIKPQQIKYFNQHKLKIKKLCVTVCGSCAFWITQNNQIYAHGRNDSYQLGLAHKNNVNTPTLIESLNDYNIVDIQSAHSYSVALASIDRETITHIVHLWYSYNITTDTILLITKYTQYNTVLSTSHSSYGGNAHTHNTDNSNSTYGWKVIPFFCDKNIIAIRTGSEHTFFLDDVGAIYGAGDNAFGQIGCGHSDPIKEVTRIDYFVDGGIAIVDIRCGLYHTLALDEDGKIYAWGHAKRGQCGIGWNVIDSECIEAPRVIQYFDDNHLVAKQIACGNYHSFVKTVDAKCFMFGSNHHHQCLVFDKQTKIVEPYCINQAVKEKTKRKDIKGVFLGCNNTKIIVR